jgi:hypothetical protein
VGRIKERSLGPFVVHGVGGAASGDGCPHTDTVVVDSFN